MTNEDETSHIRIGTAGWSIPRAYADEVPGEGSHLQRYARVFRCAEINATFYRPPRSSTWLRWAESVPDGFEFAVKAPRAITHEAGLAVSREPVQAFLSAAKPLGSRRGPVLLQLPPKLAFNARLADGFFALLRDEFDGGVVLEPRHASWFGLEPEAVLRGFRVARAAADPAVVPEAAMPGGWAGLRYYRLHGSPRRYYSEYGAERLRALAEGLMDKGSETWCIFDNTASGAAMGMRCNW